MASSYAPETRQDRITKQWVAFAPSRSTRPKRTTAASDGPDPDIRQPVEGCPFCPGHEEMLPSVLWELGGADPASWRTRAVPNKYSAFEPDRASRTQTCGLYQSRASRGHQEVIIETPNHHRPLAQMATDQVEAVLHTYLERYHTLRAETEDWFPFLFRNHGASAGASIAHPHSQLIATDVPPPQIEHEEREAQARYEETGQCPYCAMIEDELEAEARLVWTDDTFVVFVPFAARVPFEMWILPREHEPEFGRLDAGGRRRLAIALRTVLGRLRDRLDDPDYNFFVRTALSYESEAPHLHWSLRVRPRTTVQAGFELSTGLRINPSIPERDAMVLREDGGATS
ncbi:MAG: DUF4931 domain-containing protein [Salinibacter sp.]|uniref:galactose-1-phosphate uridylyltransferase n=1 Tax=Salinibacter sp. TaxID=2065818 RepID=UPI0035D50121